MRELQHISDFLCRVRRKLRFGEFSREPLQLLRLEWKVELLECDWLMRPADPFDSELPRHLVEVHQHPAEQPTQRRDLVKRIQRRPQQGGFYRYRSTGRQGKVGMGKYLPGLPFDYFDG